MRPARATRPGEAASRAHIDLPGVDPVVAAQAVTEGGLLAAPHGGELAGPSSVRDCLDDLDAQRIGHGVRAAEDPRLLRRLAPTPAGRRLARPGARVYSMNALLAIDIDHFKAINDRHGHAAGEDRKSVV